MSDGLSDVESLHIFINAIHSSKYVSQLATACTEISIFRLVSLATRSTYAGDVWLTW